MNITHVFADDITPIQPPISISPGDPPAALGRLISNLVGVILIVATIWTLFQLLQAGLEWISSGGDKSGLENARNRLTNSLLGLFIVFAAWAIYLVILQFLGISTVTSGGAINFKIPSLFD